MLREPFCLLGSLSQTAEKDGLHLGYQWNPDTRLQGEITHLWQTHRPGNDGLSPRRSTYH